MRSLRNETQAQHTIHLYALYAHEAQSNFIQHFKFYFTFICVCVHVRVCVCVCAVCMCVNACVLGGGQGSVLLRPEDGTLVFLELKLQTAMARPVVDLGTRFWSVLSR